MPDDKLSGEFILDKESSQKAITSIIEKTHPHFYSSFAHNPEGISFAEQEDGEEIILLLRRHFITNIPWIALAIFFILLPFAFPFILANTPLPLPSPMTLGLALAFYYLFIFGFILLNFTLWYFHIGLVTTFRVVDIDLAGILYRRVTETKHGNIEDVSYNQVGFITSLFNYGNVIVQTAGTEENIEFDRIPRPAKVADIIGDLAHPV